MKSSSGTRISFKAQMLRAREDAILVVVNHLLAERGFDAMTVDDVAAEVGMAKASLYKHFPSKEALATAAIIQLVHRAQAFLETLPPQADPLDKLRSALRWTLERKLALEMPALPSQHSGLRAALLANPEYLRSQAEVSRRLGAWIAQAQAQGSINPRLPTHAILCTLYAKACDPVLDFLQMGAEQGDAPIMEWVLSTCFDGLTAR